MAASQAQIAAFKNKYIPAAIEAAAGSNIFPEVVLSAAALESGYGLSGLAANYNNFFGIKAGPSWKGKKILLQTTEYSTRKDLKFPVIISITPTANGKYQYIIKDYFRVYDTAADSFRGYVNLVSSKRYADSGVTVASTQEEQFAAIKNGGYATDPKYVSKLINTLNTLGKNFSNYASNMIKDIPETVTKTIPNLVNNNKLSTATIMVGVAFFF